MTATAGQPRRRPRGRTVIAGLTTLLALWLGLTAPSVSPVAPPSPVSVQVADSVDQSAVPPAGGPAPVRRGGRR